MSRQRPVPCGWQPAPPGPCGERAAFQDVAKWLRKRKERRAGDAARVRADHAIAAAFARAMRDAVGWDADGAPVEAFPNEMLPRREASPRVPRGGKLLFAMTLAAIASMPRATR